MRSDSVRICQAALSSPAGSESLPYLLMLFLNVELAGALRMTGLVYNYLSSCKTLMTRFW